MKNKFKYIQNLFEKEATLLLYDTIGKVQNQDGTVTEGIDGTAFAQSMQYLEECGVEVVNIRINSPGGSVLEGWSIISAMKNSKMEIHTYNDGLCASIAGVIFASGDFRHFMDYGILMIHNPAGTDDEDVLIKIKESLLTILKNNSIYSTEDLNKLMNNETYLNAEEAKKVGLCEDIIFSGEKVDVSNESDPYELVNEFKQIINKMKKKKEKIEEIENKEEKKQGVESPVTLTNEDGVIDAKNEDDNEDEDGDDETEKEGEDCMNYESAYNDLKAEHEKLQANHDSLKAENDDLNSKLAAMKDEVRKEHKKKIDAMVNDLFKAGKIGKTEIEDVTILAEQNYDSVRNLFDKVGLVKNVSFKNVVETDTNNGLEKGWTIRDYEKKNPDKLNQIRNNLPAVYAQLYKEFYGVEPK